MIENLHDVSTADLIAGNHFDDIENFTMWNVELPCGEQLWGYRPRGKHIKGRDEVASLDELMGNKGTLHVKTLATNDAPAVVTMKAVGVGGDVNFRAKRVAELAEHYRKNEDLYREGFSPELPTIQDFYAENQ